LNLWFNGSQYGQLQHVSKKSIGEKLSKPVNDNDMQ